jgi:hypothetical protein
MGDCGAALDSDHGGVAIAHGVVSISGMGDWRYQGVAERVGKDGPVVGVTLVFLIPGFLEQLASYQASAGRESSTT